jgi:hypothetical protein
MDVVKLQGDQSRLSAEIAKLVELGKVAAHLRARACARAGGRTCTGEFCAGV